MKTLEDILLDINAFIDLDASLPTGTELTTRVNYANQAVWDANAITKFQEFETIWVANPSNASISLPTNFKDLNASPRVMLSDASFREYPLISPNERYDVDQDGYYSYLLGNPASGYTLVFMNMASDATLSLNYQRFPSGMATLTDICELSDPQYVVSKACSYILQGRDDARFPIVEADAQRRLANMIGENQIKNRGSIPSTRKYGASAYSLGS